MPSIQHSFNANCAPAALWAVLSDLTSVARTNPTVKSVQIVSAVQSGLGATRKCELVPKGTVTERVFAFEEGRAVGLEVVQSDWPVSTMSWTTVIEPVKSGARLVQRLDYEMKYGPVGYVLDRLVLRRMIGKTVGLALQGLIAEAEGRG